MTFRRNPAVYACLLTLVAAVMLVIAPVAHAQPAGMVLDGKTMVECMSRKTDVSAAKQMVKEHNANKPDGWSDAFPGRDQIEDVKKQNPQRFEELKKSYSENDTFGNRLGGTKNFVNCGFKNPADRVGKVVSEKKSEFWDDPIGKLARAVVESNTQALEMAMTFWTKYKIDGGKTADQATGVRNVFWSAAGIAFILSIIVTGARMAAIRRQGLADGMEDFGKFYGSYLVIGVMVPLIMPLALAGTDWLADQILTGLPQGQKFTELMGANKITDEIGGPPMVLILVLFTLVGSFTQMVALAARALILPIVVGLLPLAAASSAGQAGRASTHSLLSWMFAAIIFKPIAAMVYVVAFWVVNENTVTGPDGVAGEAGLRIIKILIIGIAGFSPLLVLKIVSPLLSSVGGQNTGAVAGTVGGAMAGLGAVLGGKPRSDSGEKEGSGSSSSAPAGNTGKGGGNGNGGQVLGGSPSGPSGGGPGGGSSTGGSPAGGSPAGGSPSGGGAPTGGSPAGGAPANTYGDQSGESGGAPAPHSDGGSPAPMGGHTSQSGGGHDAPHGQSRPSGKPADRSIGGEKIAARALMYAGKSMQHSGSLSGVFEDAGGTIRK